MAADLAAPVYRRPVAVAVPVYTWTGCYLGGDLGYQRSSYAQQLTWGEVNTSGTLGLEGGEFDFTNNLSANGAIGGLLAGCNLQTGHYVWGIETDYAWTGGNDSRLYNPELNAESVAFSASTKSVWSLRGRFGLAEGDALIYATAGLAIARFNYSYLLNDPDSEGAPASAGNFNFTTNGLVVGVGAEYRLAGNWIAGVEWLHYAFGDEKQLPSVSGAGPWGAGGDYINLKTMDVVRARLSYLFNWATPIVTK
jgi:outer membrane immunogenic protein